MEELCRPPAAIEGSVEGKVLFSSVQFSSVPQSCLTLMPPHESRSTTGLPVHQQLPEFTD